MRAAGTCFRIRLEMRATSTGTTGDSGQVVPAEHIEHSENFSEDSVSI